MSGFYSQSDHDDAAGFGAAVLAIAALAVLMIGLVANV